MKKTVSLFLTFALLLAAAMPVFAASGSMKNFEKKFTYEGQFEDVAESAWYAPYVTAAFEYGFVSGNSETTYNPDGNITLAETLVMPPMLVPAPRISPSRERRLSGSMETSCESSPVSSAMIIW